MVHPIFQNQDKKHLDAVSEAAVLFDPRPSTLILTLGTNRILPPAWLDSLSIVLHHDDQKTQVTCRAVYDGHRDIPCVFILTPMNPSVDLHAMFQADPRSFYQAVGQVEVVTKLGARMKLNNKNSLRASRKPDPRRTDDEDILFDLSKLTPSR